MCNKIKLSKREKWLQESSKMWDRKFLELHTSGYQPIYIIDEDKKWLSHKEYLKGHS